MYALVIILTLFYLFFAAHLICPVAYDDSAGIWNSQLSKLVMEQLPLSNVSWKNLNNTFVTVPNLPIRFMPSTSNLFKDTNHPFRWFLAPYAYLYVVQAASLDDYKAISGTVKQWVDQMHAVKK